MNYHSLSCCWPNPQPPIGAKSDCRLQGNWLIPRMLVYPIWLGRWPSGDTTHSLWLPSTLHSFTLHIKRLLDLHSPLLTPKVKTKFESDLRECICNNGVCGPQLFLAIFSLCKFWVCDSQELEGCMSLVKLGALRGSSQISLPLLDARVSIVKSLNMGTRSSKSFKYSQVKPSIDALIEDCREHLCYTRAIQCDARRFAPPGEYQHPIPNVTLQPATIPGEELAWCASHTLQLHRHCVKFKYLKHGSAAVVFSSHGVIKEVWVVSSSYKFSETLCRVCFTERANVDEIKTGDSVHMHKPATLQLSLNVFRSFYKVRLQKKFAPSE